ncbi:Transcriptional regulatory pro-1 [Fusarium agapanthi]|uniref:Transcriptional regulatory pro-1 n=1 Tax=Fusarium agapanthi TaxID=1803897 RepID=A0A9P5B308_9HYPO|nr:Transcriptional regulatory pro-1 [Fusarium agapanthi]
MGDAENEAKTRLKRTRTGCFKCRVRRRKCDEGKPSCQHGTKLSFLQKNAKTSSVPVTQNNQTALDGLLALGNDHYVSPSAPTVSQTGTNGGLFGQLPQNVQFEVRDKSHEDVFPNCLHMPQDRAVELLRHYRYNIAPWLDINDPDQTFGLFVPRVAMDSISVLDSVLSISLETLGHRNQLDLNEQPLLPDTSTSSIEILCRVLVFAFTTLRRQFATQPTSWLSPSKSTGYETINSTPFQLHHTTVALTVSWIILRLGVSVGLMNGSSVPIPSIVSREVSSPMSALSRERHRYGRDPVLLCAEVLNFCFGGNIQTDPDTIRLPAAHRWKAFSEALHKWYSNRPTDFKPMLETEDGEQLFPLVLFTNGAAILANQLYHTSTLLLLQNRPPNLWYQPE